ncbi:ATP-binding protein [Streptomyces jumonjinensis]|uniref:ATP-binding protein n=1 Tax=Streptomyces jumonjinensis TaxID=1945 RepID=UPI0037A9056E
MSDQRPEAGSGSPCPACHGRGWKRIGARPALAVAAANGRARTTAKRRCLNSDGTGKREEQAHMHDRTSDQGDAGADSEQLGAMTLYPVAESVPLARRWFRKLITRHQPECSLDDCLLMLSELVTNAVSYAEAEEEWRVRVDWRREERSLHVRVHSPGHPASVRMLHAAGGDEHGRGLWLVDALSDSWTVDRSEHGGTVVSFVLDKAWPE